MAVVEECGKVLFSLCRPAGEWLLLTLQTNVAFSQLFSLVATQEARPEDNNVPLQLQKTATKLVDWLVLPLPPFNKISPS